MGILKNGDVFNWGYLQTVYFEIMGGRLLAI